ncbi:MAG: exo-alpha-sialidase [Bacteroidota bacterium]
MPAQEINTQTYLNREEPKEQQQLYFNKNAVQTPNAMQTKTIEDTNWSSMNWGETEPLYDSSLTYGYWRFSTVNHKEYTHTVSILWGWNHKLWLMYSRSADGIKYERKDITDYNRFPQGVTGVHISSTDSCLLIFFLAMKNGFDRSPLYVIRSFDNGETFDSARAVSSEILISGSIFSPPAVWNDTVAFITFVNYKARFAYLYTSPDNGATWKTIKTKIPKTPIEIRSIALTTGTIHLVYSHWKNNKKYRGRETMHLRSTNMGKKWSRVNDKAALSTLDGYTSDMSQIASSDKGHLHTIWRDGKYGSSNGFTASIIYRRSLDAGKTWLPETLLTKRPDVTFHNSNALAVERTEGNFVALAYKKEGSTTNQAFARLSADGGTSWYPEVAISKAIKQGSPTPKISVSTHRVSAMWNQLVEYNGKSNYYPFVRSATLPSPKPTVAASQRENIPEIQLLNNYPNPFNPSTSISFQLSAASTVTLKVFDVLGRETMTVLENKKYDKGKYEAEFNASPYPSGVYFARISVETLWGDKYSEVKKMVVTK